MSKQNDEISYITALLAEGKELSEQQTEKLILFYLPDIRIKAKKMSQMYPSVDFDDLVSEGLLGFMKALRHFDGSKNVLFSTFSDVCVVNNMRTVVSKTLGGDHGMKKQDEFDFEMLADGSLSAEDAMIDREQDGMLFKKLSGLLSKTEFSTLSLYISGCSYERIARQLGKDVKSVDNALQRAKSKIRRSNILGK